MTTAQKIIKYCAVVFGIFLAVSIIGGIVGAVAGISGAVWEEDMIGEMQTYAVSGAVERLEIDLSGAQLAIKTGESFSVESDHKALKLEDADGLLRIYEDHPAVSFHSGAARIELTVPEDFAFDRVELSTGAGTVKIDALTAEVLSLELGAGKAEIDRLVATGSARINGGAGELDVGGGALANLKLDMGVGEVNLESRLTGSCEIDHSVGELNLTLLGAEEDYSVTLDKGVGEATLDGKKMNDGETHGSGVNTVRIDGGVGALRVGFHG